MNARQRRAIQDEYERLEGIPQREVTTKLWDASQNRHRDAQCIVIDLGRRPAVIPYALTAEDKELVALRGAKIPRERSTDTLGALGGRLHAWLKGKGAVTHREASAAINISEAQAKQLLTSNAHLFKLWKKIAGQSYFIAI